MTVTTSKVAGSSFLTKMSKKQLIWSFWSLKLIDSMTKDEMLAKIQPVLNPEVLKKVKAGGEY